MGEQARAGDVELYVERRGEGPDVLLIAGLSDPAEAWQFQLDGLADRYRLTAFDNRGAGRTPLPEGPLSVPMMGRRRGHTAARAGGPGRPRRRLLGGSLIAQEVALRHPELVRSLVLMSGADARARRRARRHRASTPRTRRRRGDPGRSVRDVAGEAHQPFQEVPDEFDARIDAFWREVEAQG